MSVIGMTDDDLADLGMERIGAGIKVFVIKFAELPTKIDKHPTTRNGHDDATLDPLELVAQIESARRRLPGVPLGIGEVPGSAGNVVLDYDTKNGGRGGEMLERHRAKYGEDFDKVSYTSVSGAVNVMLRKPDTSVPIANTSPWLKDDVDVRADNGWIVGPGNWCPWGSWDWRSGEYGDLADAVMPADMFKMLTVAGDTDSAPASRAESEAWLDAGKGPDDEFTQGELGKHVASLAVCGNRNPTLFEALSWLRRLDPSSVDRRAAFDAIDAAWQARMTKDGEKRRQNEPWQVLERVVGFDKAIMAEAAEAQAEAEAEERSSFDVRDLGPALDGDIEQVMPDMLRMDDGRCLLYSDRVNEIHGDSGTGKSWAPAFAIKEATADGGVIMVVDLEDTEAPLIQRLRQIGVTDTQIRDHLAFIHPSDEFTAAAVTHVVEQCNALGVRHVFIDSLGEAFAVDGVNENNDDEVAPWIRKVSRRIVNETDAGVTHIDHITKSGDNALHPSGSKRKRAAITGSSWLLTAVVPFSKVSDGRVKWQCGKDRHGNYKRAETVAEMHMTFIGGMCSLELVALAVADAAEYNPAADETREHVLTILRHVFPNDLGVNAVFEEFKHRGYKARKEAITGALENLKRLGQATESADKNRSRKFRAVMNPPSGSA